MALTLCNQWANMCAQCMSGAPRWCAFLSFARGEIWQRGSYSCCHSAPAPARHAEPCMSTSHCHALHWSTAIAGRPDLPASQTCHCIAAPCMSPCQLDKTTLQMQCAMQAHCWQLATDRAMQSQILACPSLVMHVGLTRRKVNCALHESSFKAVTTPRRAVLACPPQGFSTWSALAHCSCACLKRLSAAQSATRPLRF